MANLALIDPVEPYDIEEVETLWQVIEVNGFGEVLAGIQSFYEPIGTRVSDSLIMWVVALLKINMDGVVREGTH